MTEQKKAGRAAFLNLGCKVNAYETDAMKLEFERNGYEIVPFEEKADVYVVNTCTVTNIADRKSRQMLHRARSQNPEAVVAAVGCYAQVAGKKLLEDPAVDLLIGNSEKSRAVELVEAYRSSRKREDILPAIAAEKQFEPLEIDSADGKTRAYIKVQDGCNQFCTYCIIPYARGRVRSRDLTQIQEEAAKIAGAGYREIVLTGIHLASYGVDFGQEDGLLRLILSLSTIEGIRRIRLGSLEPGIITKAFLQALQDDRRFCPHFHLSLQSGCDRTLRRMNRRYTTAEFEEKCEMIRSTFDYPALTTDLIVGFPGETEEDFEETCAFARRIGFSQIHIFKYSRRDGTKAAAMPDQVPEPEKARRSAVLSGIEEELRRAYREKLLGSVEEVLLEEVVRIEDQDWCVGHNERYVRIGVPAGGAAVPGEMRRIRVLRLAKDLTLLGELSGETDKS